MGNSENSLNMEALFGSKLLSASGEVSTTEALSGKKAIALYFSAHWCPPCRGFTPQFAKWYEDDLKGKGLEVVFVSSDQDEASFPLWSSSTRMAPPLAKMAEDPS